MKINIRPRISYSTMATDGHEARSAVHTHHLLRNPFTDLNDGVTHLNRTLDGLDQFFHAAGYWMNPVNVWRELGHVFVSGSLDSSLIVATILGIMLLMGGATWPKKWIFWGWVVFWILRGMVFV